MKKILLLGGSAQQIVAIETAKRLGCFTILCDYLTDNPGQYVADKFYLASTTDKELILKIAQKEKIDGILAYASDPAAPTAAYVVEKLNLPGTPYWAVDALCNKDKFRLFLKENGFHTPHARGYHTVEKVLSEVNDYQFPVIVKPVDSSGSKGVTIVYDKADFPLAIADALSFSRAKRIIVEEFIQKAHPYLIGGDIFVVDGKIVLWGLMNCHRDEKVNKLVPIGKSYPLVLDDDKIQLVKQTLQLMVEKLSFENGAMNVELIIDQDDNVWPIDIGPRSGGNMIPDLLSCIFEIDVVELSVQVAMGENPSLKDIKNNKYYATHNLHCNKNGKLKEILFLPEIEPYIVKKCLYKKEGDCVEYFANSAKALGIVFFKFNSLEEMVEILETINQNIEIVLSPLPIRVSQCNTDILRENFWKKDAENGRIIGAQYDEIKTALNAADLSWVQEKFKEIKQHAIWQTDYYKNYTVDDVFPVMDKITLIENYTACTAKSGYNKPLHVSSTSGSTGTPFSVIQDYKKRNRTIADLKVFGELCDYPSHERMVFFRIISEKLHRTPEQENEENIYYIDSSNLSGSALETMYFALLEKKPRIVFSYSSTLVKLAEYISERKLSTSTFSMKSVLTGGEGISENDRMFLSEIFGCKVYRRYSDMELGILGQDMGDGGSYILNWGSYYFECLRLNSDDPAENGEIGRIVITDLFNYAFPMIRYDTGDLGAMGIGSNGLPCLTEIHGRVRDCIYSVSGDLISPAKIFVTMWGAEYIKQWQFIQEGKTEYILKLNCTQKTTFTDLIQKIKGVLGEEANIKICLVDEIPVASSNKRRAVICNYKK